MLSQLDYILFPDRCEVYEVVPSQRYVYAIFKNGRSSLLMCAKDHKWRIFFNEQIARLSSIDVILRDPQERLISGINIYLQQILQEDSGLDQNTAIWFIKKYPFLNRHYCPQFHWLLNLARYTNSNTQLNFYGMSELWSIVDRDVKPDGFQSMPSDFAEQIGQMPEIEMYHRLDQILIDRCMGKSLTFQEVLEGIKTGDPVAYERTVGRSKKISDLL